MTEHTADPVTQDGAGTRPEPPRLAPRPLERPEVDAEAAAAFGRPQGVNGAFEAPLNGAQQSHPANGVVRPAAQPQAALATAYGRPDDGRRPPPAPARRAVQPGWRRARRSGPRAAAVDPWRNPDSPVGLGPPVDTLPPKTRRPRLPPAPA